MILRENKMKKSIIFGSGIPAETKYTEKIDVDRLHKVHRFYPIVPRRMGKTTYCYDSLLRCSETGAYKEIAYITNTLPSAKESFYYFLEYLDNEEVIYQKIDQRTVVVNYSKITFLSSSENKFCKFDGFIIDKY